MRTLHIRLLGDFRILYGEKPVEEIDTPRPQSVLAYLLLHRQAPQARHHVAFALWPTSTEAQAHTNLRKQLYHLRRALPDAERFLHIDSHTVGWRPEAPFTLDVADFEGEIANARRAEEAGDLPALRRALERAIDLYHGDLLPSCYDDWLLPLREELSRRHLRAVDQLTQMLESRREYSAAIGYAQRLLRFDPLHETTYRRLMTLHALNGDRAKAFQVYHECAAVLERELGVEPNPATRTAYERLMAAEPVTPPVRAEPSLPLVGRQRPWGRLLAAWQVATREGARLALVSGEAGIGKTKLVEELVKWAERQGVATATTRSFAVEGPLAYAPVIGWLRTPTLQRALSRLEEVWLTELARLLPELLIEKPELPRPEPLTESWQRQRLFEALGHAFLAAGQPLLLFIDDLQWSDAQTLAWLHYLLRFVPQAKVLVAGTLRPEEVTGDRPLTSLLTELRSRGELIEIELGRLNEAETTALAEQVAEHELNTEERARLYRETEGNPLFIVETLRARLADLARTSPHFDLLPYTGEPPSDTTCAALPPKVHAVIERRLKELSPEARALVDVAAVVGREFSTTVLTQVSQHDESTLVDALDELWQRRIIRERDGNIYDFSHNKLREIAYCTLSLVRRRLLHSRVAKVLEALCTTPAPEMTCDLARHYTAAGEMEKALAYRLAAGRRALALSAHREATLHLREGLALLEMLPDTAGRTETELALRMALGSALIPQQGFTAPEVREVYNQAAALARRMEEVPQLVPVLYGLGQYAMLQGNWEATHRLGERALCLAERRGASGDLLLAHSLLGFALSYMGQPALALSHLQQGLEHYTQESGPPATGTDLGVLVHGYAALMRWILGYPAHSLEEMGRALNLARALSHPHTLAAALNHAAGLHLLRREPERTEAQLERAIAISTEYEFPYWLGIAQILRGWALAQRGEAPKGLVEAHRGLDTLTALGVDLNPYTHTLLAEAHGRAGNATPGLRAADEALADAAASGLRAFESMTWRVRGDLLQLQGAAAAEVESAYRQAIEVAREQEARSFELQATLRLCLLWRRERPVEARQMLAELYATFTEGHDSPDLQAAQALLEALAQGPKTQ
ncbi:MAG: BTAD domain-containing putative transcriptional regulator [Anaerolineales bacterium]